MTRKRLLQNLALVVVTVLVMGVALEAGYRVYLYFRLQQFIDAPRAITLIDQPLFVYDADVGYSHTPNATVRFAWVNPEGDVFEEHRVVTNNAGWVSRYDYVEDKAEDEFRVVVMGDSVTANLENSITWVDELSDLLNADAELLDYLGVESISVYSFGQAGTGFLQFEAVYEHEASRYDPDLVMVNFIVNDIGREFIWRQSFPLEEDYAVSLQCVGPDIGGEDCQLQSAFTAGEAIWNDLSRVDVILQDRVQERLAELPWFSLHSEVLARVLGGRKLVLSYGRSGQRPDGLEDINEDTIVESIESLRNIEAQSSEFLALMMHLQTESVIDEASGYRAEDMREMAGDMPFVLMGEYMPDESEQDRQEMYHHPYDLHPKDAFLRIYAQAVYEMLVTDYWDVR